MRNRFSSLPWNGKLMRELSSERSAVKLSWAIASFCSEVVLRGEGRISSWRAGRRERVGEIITSFGESGITNRAKGEFRGGGED